MAIADFPPEIYSTIFSFALQSYTRKESYHQRFAFSQVCRAWRSMALADPTLWRVLEVHAPTKWVRALIRRSRGSNLDVELTDRHHWSMPRAIERHFSGIETLRLDLNHYESSEALLLQGCVRAISTQELPLRVLKVDYFDQLEDLAHPTPTDEAVAAIIARCPRLEKLTLSSFINLRWDVPLPSSLTTLRLGAVARPYGDSRWVARGGLQRPDLKTFLDALRQTPNLRRLYLRHCTPKDGLGPLPPIGTHKVDLPRLTNIQVEETHLPTQSFLRYLNFPPEGVSLGFDNEESPPLDEPFLVIRYISDRFEDSNPQFRWPAPRQLLIAINPGHFRLAIGFWPVTTQGRDVKDWKKIARQRLGSKSNVDLGFRYPIEEIDQDPPSIPLFIRLSRVLPLDRLEVLNMKAWAFRPFTPQDFADLFKNLPELIYLEAHGWNPALWEALEGLQRDAQPPTIGFLPKLRYVTVDLQKFRYRADDNELELQDASLGSIEEWLTTRAASDGLKLARLEFVYWRDEVFYGIMPEFESLADDVLYTHLGNSTKS